MNEVFKELVERELIFPGSVIEVDVLEEAFNLKRTSDDFVWKKLAIKERIKMDGYFVTDKNCSEGSFLILKTEDMADYAEKKLIKNKNSNEKVALILKAHDIASLNEEQKKKHNFVQEKAAQCASSMSLALLKSEVW